MEAGLCQIQSHILIYQVQYSGITVSVNSLTTTLMFAAPSLPDGASTGTVVVMVTAINQYGIGPASAATAEIRGNTLHLYVYTQYVTY